MANMIQVAEIALSIFPPEAAVIMTAIAGGESSFDTQATGDTPAFLESLGYTSSARTARGFNCPLGSDHGYASVGLWQIFMPVHKDLLRSLGAPIHDPCQTANWLMDPVNNAMAAHRIWSRSGFSAWSAYNNGSYRRHMEEAEKTVASILNDSGGEIPIRRFHWPFIAVGLMTVGYVFYGLSSKRGDRT